MWGEHFVARSKVAVSLSNKARRAKYNKKKIHCTEKKGKKENKRLDFPLFHGECLVFDDNSGVINNHFS